MKNIYNFLVFFVLLLCVVKANDSFAQIDDRFWFAAPDITRGHNDRPIFLRFSTLDKPATVVVSMPRDAAFPTQVINLAAYSTGELDLTTWINLVETPRMTTITGVQATDEVDANRNYNNKFPNGILIESTAKITAYYEASSTNNPEMFALKGKNALGKDFWIPMQTAWNHQSRTPNAYSGFVIVATEDNTSVTITTTRPTRTFSATGASGTTAAAGTRTIMLNRGETFNVASQQPTAGNAPVGSRVVSDKPVAVTLFHDTILTGQGSCYDLAGDQLVPTNVLGTEYIVMRGSLGVGGTAQPEKVYVLATQAGTTLTINRGGASIAGIPTLAAGQQYAFDLTEGTHPSAYITSNKPVYVLHMSGYGCETGAAILPPIECTGSRLTQVRRSTTDNFTLTILVKAGGEANFSLNGGAVNTAIPASSFTNVSGTTAWKSARITLTTAQVASGAIASVRNTTTLFHMGVTNGNATGGCRYGYFSAFNSLNLGPDISIFYGSNATLDAETFGALDYLWYPDLQTTPQITVDVRRTRDYIVRVNLGQCYVYDTICVGTVEYVWVGDQKDPITGIYTGEYGDFKNWSAPCGQSSIPDCSQDIVIPALVNGIPPFSFPIIKANRSCRNIIIENGASITINPNQRLDVCGDMVHSGTLFMPTNSTLQFIGLQPQTYTRTATGKGNFENLWVNNQTPSPNVPRVKVSDAGTQNMVVSKTGSLTFIRGILQTEGNKEVVIQNPNSNSVTGFVLTNNSTDRFVGGRLRRAINTMGTYNFPVGLAVENLGVATVVATKRANIVNTTAANWVTPTATSDKFCQLNPLLNNRIIHLTDNQSSVPDAVAARHLQFPADVAILGNNPRTLEAWVSINPSPSNGAIFYMGTDKPKQLFALRKNGTTTGFRIDLGGGVVKDFTYSGLLSSSTTTYNWHHFAMTYNGSEIVVYIDGNEVPTANYNVTDLNTTITSATNNKFYVGRYRSDAGNNWYLSGKYDNIRIWNVARAQAEIASNYCVRYECTIPPELIGNYDLEDGFGIADHKLRNCTVNPLQYEQAKVEFQNPITDGKYILSYFNQYGSVPNSPNERRCQANFGSCPVLDHGFWTLSAYSDSTLSTKVAGDGKYRLTLFNNAYTNAGACGSPQTAIMKRNTSADPWSIPNLPALCYDNSVVSTAMEWMSGFSDFGVPMTLDPVILPVELLSLTAKPLYNSILIEWKTANEIDIEGYEIWRSDDNQTFAKVGWVEAKSANRYIFEDEEVKTNLVYYYYLKQMSNNAQDKASPVVSAKIEGGVEGGIKIYPNPTSNEFTIDLNEIYLANTIYKAEIYNSVGMLLKTKTSGNSSKIKMSLEGLSKGMYLVKVITPTRTKFVKIEKE
ncbi:LamG-like jellyroll fold domain-containing protein [Bernardetia sp.]|uniref:LamG-like jellyroll fold domain-containing protein n=1 Tax=Bernardetia sp. TaxID=1937974 RepID=UPI0025BE1B26|nr:LamG-like jellyroll fold domain-containing protein [Bernardetia sp.]